MSYSSKGGVWGLVRAPFVLLKCFSGVVPTGGKRERGPALFFCRALCKAANFSLGLTTHQTAHLLALPHQAVSFNMSFDGTQAFKV